MRVFVLCRADRPADVEIPLKVVHQETRDGDSNFASVDATLICSSPVAL